MLKRGFREEKTFYEKDFSLFFINDSATKNPFSIVFEGKNVIIFLLYDIFTPFFFKLRTKVSLKHK
jgi:hypothetical protein